MLSDDDFVLRLNTKSQNEEMILAKITPKSTLAETIAHVQQRIQQRDADEYEQQLHLEESLVIPIISLRVQREFTELISKKLRNKGYTALYVTEAKQGIRFRLDETGADLSSEAEFAVAAIPPPPRHFIFDKPFLLYVKPKDGDAPYVALWVETPEVLETTTP